MLKRQASGPKPARKKKKGNATFAETSLDSTPEDKIVEDVCVWNLKASATGQVGGTRKTHRYYHQAPLEELSTSENPEGPEETAVQEDTGNLADSETPIDMQRPKRKKRVRTHKENDSVSGIY